MLSNGRLLPTLNREYNLDMIRIIYILHRFQSSHLLNYEHSIIRIRNKETFPSKPFNSYKNVQIMCDPSIVT